MAITYTDAFGPVVDTGVASQPTQRTNTEIETHTVMEVETGSKLNVQQIQNTHIPHRPANHPR